MQQRLGKEFFDAFEKKKKKEILQLDEYFFNFEKKNATLQIKF